MKAAVYSQKNDLEAYLYLSKFISELNNRGVEAVLYQPMREKLQFYGNFETFSSHEDLKEKDVQFFFCLGGDGTILNALTFIQSLDIPVVGVNTGRLGFLASYSKEGIFNDLDKVISGDVVRSERSVIKISTTSNQPIEFPFALNEVSITRKETTSMVTIDSYINDEFLTVFWADGVIVSTPTGSTAYSLSCGGPIISPTDNSFSITPIAPHNLNVRPLVLKDDVKIRLKVESRVPEYSLSLDSRLYTIPITEELFIEKADFTLSLIQSHETSFFETIRQKLLWGNDKRN